MLYVVLLTCKDIFLCSQFRLISNLSRAKQIIYNIIWVKNYILLLLYIISSGLIRKTEATYGNYFVKYQ